MFFIYILYSNLYKILKIFFVCIHIHMQKNAMHCTYNVIISCHPIGRANMGWNDEQCCARLVHHWAGQGDGGDPWAHLQGARYHQLSFWEGAPVPKVPWGARTEEVCSLLTTEMFPKPNCTMQVCQWWGEVHCLQALWGRLSCPGKYIIWSRLSQSCCHINCPCDLKLPFRLLLLRPRRGAMAQGEPPDTTSTWPSVSTAGSARRPAPWTPSWRDPTLSSPRRPTRSCCITRRSCWTMVTSGRLKSQPTLKQITSTDETSQTCSDISGGFYVGNLVTFRDTWLWSHEMSQMRTSKCCWKEKRRGGTKDETQAWGHDKV